MADTDTVKTVESTIEEKKVEEKEKLAEKTKEEAKVEENGDKVENGDSKEEDEEKPEEKEPTTDKCCIKRKSTGDSVDGKEEKSTPEKKAKLDTAPEAEAEANGEVTEAEAAA